MNTEENIQQLQAKLESLSLDVAAYREEVAGLKKHIENLTTSARPRVTQRAPSNFTIENFIGLKLIHFVGIIVLIIGISIGVKYAIDVNIISPALRVLLAYSAGILLFIISLKLRKKYGLFSIILFGGAMASLYFTTYAAFAYYGM